MTNEEYFKNWGEEYRQAAADLKDRIKKLKIQRKKLQGDDALILEGKITSLLKRCFGRKLSRWKLRKAKVLMIQLFHGD